MKTRTFIYVSAFLLVLAAIIYDSTTNKLQSQSSGPSFGNSGSPLDGGNTCNRSGCHVGANSNTLPGLITSNILACGYNAGQTYTITATIARNGHDRFGFQISPTNSTNSNTVGTLISTSNQTSIPLQGWIGHSINGTLGTNLITWTFDWTAPVAGTGSVTFWGAFLATDNMFNSAGDSVFLSTLTVPEFATPSQPSTISGSTNLCAGSQETYSVTPVAGVFYTWSLPSGWTGSSTTNSINATAGTTGGTISVTATNNCGSGTSTARTLSVTVTPIAPVSISISRNPTGAICQGTSVTFTASPTNGGAGPDYQWKLNGGNVGTNNTTYTTSSLANGDVVTCVLTSNAACATGNPATSNSLTITVNPSLPVSISISRSPTGTICQGTSVTFTATPTNGGGSPDYQWKLNGGNVGTNSTTYSTSSLANGDVVTCELTSNANCATGNPAISNSITMAVNPSLPVSVSIAASPSGTICQGTSVTFTASPTNGGAGPSYQWKLNGSNVGSNSTTYTNSSLANGDDVTCVLTSNVNCPSGNPATSNTITMTVNPNLPVGISISASPNDTICPVTSVTFTATPSNGGSNPSYQWKLNGGNAGTNNPTYTNASLVDGDVVTCVLTSNANCITGNPATSNNITMVVTNNLPVTVSIAANPGNTVCQGTTVTFTASPTNGGNAPDYQWKLNGGDVGTNSASYSNSSLSSGDVITCVLTSNVTCATGNPATSNAITMTVNPNLPVGVSITRSPTGAICQGTSVTFTATPTNGGGSPDYQWKLNGGNVGTNSTTYSTSSLANGDVVTCVLTSNATCVTGNPATSNALTITVNPSQPVSIIITASPSGAICQGISVTFTATPANGGSSPDYQWKLNGGNVGTNSTTYTTAALSDGDIVTCELTSNATCATGNPSTSNAITVTVNPILPVSISIAAVPSGPVCLGTPVTFTATISHGGAGPQYQWKLNGGNVGTNNPSYTNSSLADGDEITCELTSNASCISGNPATSNTLTMTVIPNIPVSVSISAIPSGPICDGDTVTFTASPVNGGVSPDYTWYVNGSNSGTGASFTSFTLVDGDQIYCELNSSEPCVTGNPAQSNTMTITVNPILQVSVTISVSPNDSICPNTNVLFTPNPVNGGSIPAYEWFLNGGSVSSGNTYSTSSLNQGDVVQVVLTSNAICVVGNPATSNSIPITEFIVSTPVITLIDTILNTSGSGTYQWLLNGAIINGATTQSYTPLQNGDYTVAIVDSNGCADTSSIYTYVGVGIGTAEYPAEFMIFPNPNSGQFTVILPEPGCHVLIYNSYGQILFSSAGSKYSELKIEHFERGVYFIHVSTRKHTMIRKLFVYNQ